MSANVGHLPSGIYVAAKHNQLLQMVLAMPEHDLGYPRERLWSKGQVFLMTGETTERSDQTFLILRGIYRPTPMVRWFGLLAHMDHETSIEPLEDFNRHFTLIDESTAVQLLSSWKRRHLTPEAREVLTCVASGS